MTPEEATRKAWEMTKERLVKALSDTWDAPSSDTFKNELEEALELSWLQGRQGALYEIILEK